MKKILLPMLMAAGLVSGRAEIHQYTITFAPEAVGAQGTGSGTANYDDALHLLQLQAVFSGLSSGGTGTTAAHIHAATPSPFSGTAGVATTTPSFEGFPLGVFSGSFSNTLDLTLSSSWNPTYVTANGGTTAGAEAALFAAMDAGKAYWNIHTSNFGSGEIRGFLTPVPEPSSLAIAGLGITVFAVRARKVRRK